MRKLKLNLDALNVESFGTARPVGEIGTVQANQQQEEYTESEVTGCTCATGDFTMGCNMESFTRCDWTFIKC
ncbi:MAG TPA: hypothetical protein VFY65_19150 [Longimicrobium sp.]|nr:hypothetical protein [Longimicrobium sp.]